MAVRLLAYSTGRILTQKDYSGTHFYQWPSQQGHSVAERISSLQKFNDLIVTLTRNLPACKIEPQPTTLPYTPAIAIHNFRDWCCRLYNICSSSTKRYIGVSVQNVMQLDGKC
jgi:hypothetical protein